MEKKQIVLLLHTPKIVHTTVTTDSYRRKEENTNHASNREPGISVSEKHIQVSNTKSIHWGEMASVCIVFKGKKTQPLIGLQKTS